MPDWRSSMQQTFEFYTVDPRTWADVTLLTNVKSCTINRDSSAETLGSATIDIVDSVGESYIRVYLITVQNGLQERFPLGTFLVQTPSSSYDGKIKNISMDAYTPLLELKEKQPPIGYYVPKGENIMSWAYRIVREQVRVPVIEAKYADDYHSTLHSNFIADPNETWLSFLTDLISNAKYQFDLDDMSRILFTPKQDRQSLQPVWTYDDSNSSILYPAVSLDHDLYGIPNKIEVMASSNNGGRCVVAINDDPNSPTSYQNRGNRWITHRVTDPDIAGFYKDDNVDTLQEYADRLLRSMSTIEYTLTYTHGYCPVRVGDCVRFNYSRAGLTNIKAVVTNQSIKCEAGCSVTETATYSAKLWG